MFSIINDGISASCERMLDESRKLGQYEEEIRRCISELSRMSGFEECVAKLSEYAEQTGEERALNDEAEYILDRVNQAYHQTEIRVEDRVEMGSVKYPVYSLSGMSDTAKDKLGEFVKLII